MPTKEVIILRNSTSLLLIIHIGSSSISRTFACYPFFWQNGCHLGFFWQNPQQITWQLLYILYLLANYIQDKVPLILKLPNIWKLSKQFFPSPTFLHKNTWQNEQKYRDCSARRRFVAIQPSVIGAIIIVLVVIPLYLYHKHSRSAFSARISWWFAASNLYWADWRYI